jgi:hypothetical protein
LVHVEVFELRVLVLGDESSRSSIVSLRVLSLSEGVNNGQPRGNSVHELVFLSLIVVLSPVGLSHVQETIGDALQLVYVVLDVLREELS